MKFRPKDSIKKFQMGGPVDGPTEETTEPMPAEGAPAPEPEGGDPLMEVAQLAVQALQTQNCEAAFQVCLIFLQMILQTLAQPEPQGEPVFKKGGVLIKRVRK